MPKSLAGVGSRGIRGQDRRGGTGFILVGVGWVALGHSPNSLCTLSCHLPTHSRMVFCVEKTCSGLGAALISAKTGPRWASKQMVGQAQKTGKKGTGWWLCVYVNLGVPFPLWASLCLLGVKGTNQDTLTLNSHNLFSKGSGQYILLLHNPQKAKVQNKIGT